MVDRFLGRKNAPFAFTEHTWNSLLHALLLVRLCAFLNNSTGVACRWVGSHANKDALEDRAKEIAAAHAVEQIGNTEGQGE